MHVAVIDPAAYSLPYDVELCEALAREGHEVTLYTTKFAHGPMPTTKLFTIVEHFYRRRIPFLSRRHGRAVQHVGDLRRLRKVLLRTRPDIVHVQWSVVDQVDPRFWGKLPLPVVFTAHNAVPREGEGESLDPEKLQAFDAVVTHSSYGEQGLRATGLVRRLWRIRHGAIADGSAAGEPVTPPLSIDPDAPLVALPGLLRPYKGIDLLLRAWPAVRAGIPDAQLVIAGRAMDFTAPDELPEGAQLLTKFLPSAEFRWIVDRASVVCLPYTAIDQSGVLFVALALGKPLVLSDVGGFKEFVGSGAEIFPAGDVDALAETLIRVLGNTDLATRLGDEATAAAAGAYSWDSIAAEYTRHYRELVDA